MNTEIRAVKGTSKLNCDDKGSYSGYIPPACRALLNAPMRITSFTLQSKCERVLSTNEKTKKRV